MQPRISHGYLDGVVLAVNAVPDAFLYLDCPACGYEKILSVAGTHDLLSELYRGHAGHRVFCTRVDPDRLVHDRTDQLTDRLRQRTRAPSSSTTPRWSRSCSTPTARSCQTTPVDPVGGLAPYSVRQRTRRMGRGTGNPA